MTLEEAEVKIAETQARQAAEDAMARRAVANPLPGPTAQAMALNQDIAVGKWKVRAVCDGDYEVLKALDHPLCKVMEAQFDIAFKGKTDATEADFNLFLPRGPKMWELAWMFTRPPKVVRKTIKAGTVSALQDAAEDEFADVQTPVLASLYLAVAQQLSVAWSTAISYGPVPKDGEGAAADAPENP